MNQIIYTFKIIIIKYYVSKFSPKMYPNVRSQHYIPTEKVFYQIQLLNFSFTNTKVTSNGLLNVDIILKKILKIIVKSPIQKAGIISREHKTRFFFYYFHVAFSGEIFSFTVRQMSKKRKRHFYSRMLLVFAHVYASKPLS